MTHVALTSVTSQVMFRDSDANVSDTVGSAGGVSSAPSVADAAGDVDAPPSGSSSPPPSNEIAKTIAPRTSSASTTMNAIHPAPSRFEPRPPPSPLRPSRRPVDGPDGAPVPPDEARGAAAAGAAEAGGW